MASDLAGEVYSLPTSKESEAANHNSVLENIRTDKRASSGTIPLTVNMLEMSKKNLQETGTVEFVLERGRGRQLPCVQFKTLC